MSNLPEKRGDRIARSKLYRDFCCGCGEPIRVTEADGQQTCEDCRGHRDGMMRGEQGRALHQRYKLGSTRS